MSFLVSIPIPPSVNAMYRNNKDAVPKGIYTPSGNRRGRYKTKEYRAWIERAGWEIKAQNPTPVTGPYKLFLTLPRTRGDPSNRIKSCEDLLVSLGLIPDDKHAVKVSVEVVDELRDFATVSVEAA